MTDSAAVERDRTCKRAVNYQEGPDEGDGKGPRAKPQRPEVRPVPVHELVIAALRESKIDPETQASVCTCSFADLAARSHPGAGPVVSLRFVTLPPGSNPAKRLHKWIAGEYKDHPECGRLQCPHILDGVLSVRAGRLCACFWDSARGDWRLIDCIKEKSTFVLPYESNVWYVNERASKVAWNYQGIPLTIACMREDRNVGKLKHEVTLQRQPDSAAYASSDEEAGIDEAQERELEGNARDPVLPELQLSQGLRVARDYYALTRSEREIAQHAMNLAPPGKKTRLPSVNQRKAAQQVARAFKALPVGDDPNGLPGDGPALDFDKLASELEIGPAVLTECHVVVAALGQLVPHGAIRRRPAPECTADLTAGPGQVCSVPSCFHSIVDRMGAEPAVLGVLMHCCRERPVVAWLLLVAFARDMEACGQGKDTGKHLRWDSWMRAGNYLGRFQTLLMNDAQFLELDDWRDDGMWFARLLHRLEGGRDAALYKVVLTGWRYRLEDMHFQATLQRFALNWITFLMVAQSRSVVLVPALEYTDCVARGDPDHGFVLPAFIRPQPALRVEPRLRAETVLADLPEYQWLVPKQHLMATLGLNPLASRQVVESAIRFLGAGEELEFCETASGIRIKAVIPAAPAPKEALKPGPDAGPEQARSARASMELDIFGDLSDA
jgi:hypothetical protein